MMSQLSRPSRKSPATKAAGLLFATQISGCAIPDLVGRDPTSDENNEIKTLVHNEPIYRDIVTELVKHSDVEMTDIWSGDIDSNSESMQGFDSEIGDGLLSMLKEGRIKVYSGEELFGGVKEDSVAFFTDTPISRNTDDGYIFLNADLRELWTTGVVVHEIMHSSFGPHSDEVKSKCFSENTFNASNPDDVQCIIDAQDTPSEFKVLYDVAQVALEKDEDSEYEIFFDADWSRSPNAVFDELEREESRTQQEWAKEVASRTYPVTSTVLSAFGVDRDGLTESLANSEKAWEAHQELLSEIRIEVEKEYLAEAQAELREQEHQQEANEEMIKEELEEARKAPESRYEEEGRDGYRLNRR